MHLLQTEAVVLCVVYRILDVIHIILQKGMVSIKSNHNRSQKIFNECKPAGITNGSNHSDLPIESGMSPIEANVSNT